MLTIIDKLPSREEQITFYNSIFSGEENHWNRELNRTFDVYFTEILAGNYWPGARSFLEIGCGDGRFFDIAHPVLSGLGLEISAIDYSPNAIRLAQQKGYPIQFICEDFLYWAEKQRIKFDIIYSNGTFEHFDKIEAALTITHSILSERGFFLLSVPNCLGYDINKDDQREGFRRLNGGSRQIEWHLRQATWHGLLLDAGFQVNFFRGLDERIGFNWIARI